MNSFISELLRAEEPLFTQAIKNLERDSGKKKIDIKLQSEIIQKAQSRIKMLGLDPQDSTGEEIYESLVGKVHEHEMILKRRIGIKSTHDLNSSRVLIKNKVDATNTPRQCWVLKKSVARKFLIDHPPAKMMKLLGYKDVKEMVKKEDINELYGAIRFSEGSEWLTEFNKNYDNLQSKDFTTREIEIVVMPKRWADLAEDFIDSKRHNITHSKEMGVIIMLPIKQNDIPGLTLFSFSLLLHYINEIRLYSTFFKLQKNKTDFAKIFINTLIADTSTSAIIAGQNIHWRVIQRYLGKHEDEFYREIFEPHVQPEDLHWRAAEELLFEVVPEFEFWQGMDYVGLLFDNRALTFNLFDVAAGYANHRGYDDRVVYHFRESLWNEIFMRYMGEENLKQQILEQLDNDLIKPEKLQG